MAGSRSRISHRRLWLVRVFAMLAGLGALLATGHEAQAQQNVEMTMMFHGSVGGKIAPCG